MSEQIMKEANANGLTAGSTSDGNERSVEEKPSEIPSKPQSVLLNESTEQPKSALNSTNNNDKTSIAIHALSTVHDDNTDQPSKSSGESQSQETSKVLAGTGVFLESSSPSSPSTVSTKEEKKDSPKSPRRSRLKLRLGGKQQVSDNGSSGVQKISAKASTSPEKQQRQQLKKASSPSILFKRKKQNSRKQKKGNNSNYMEVQSDDDDGGGGDGENEVQEELESSSYLPANLWVSNSPPRKSKDDDDIDDDNVNDDDDDDDDNVNNIEDVGNPQKGEDKQPPMSSLSSPPSPPSENANNLDDSFESACEEEQEDEEDYDESEASDDSNSLSSFESSSSVQDGEVNSPENSSSKSIKKKSSIVEEKKDESSVNSSSSSSPTNKRIQFTDETMFNSSPTKSSVQPRSILKRPSYDNIDPPPNVKRSRAVSFSDEFGGQLSSQKEIAVSPNKLLRRVRRMNNSAATINSTNETMNYANNDNNVGQKSTRTWGFASFFGMGSKKIENCTEIDRYNNEVQFQTDDNRLLILLMDPPSKQYELTSILYPNSSNIRGNHKKPAQLGELIPLISDAASHEPLKKQVYIGFTRPAYGVEMLNTLSVVDYSIQKDEVLIAIPDGYNAKECAKFAKPILEDTRLVRLLKKLKKAQRKQEKLKSRGGELYKTKGMKKIDERTGGGYCFGFISGSFVFIFFLVVTAFYKQYIDLQQQQQILEAKPCFGNIMCRMKNNGVKNKKKESQSKPLALSRIFEEGDFPL